MELTSRPFFSSFVAQWPPLEFISGARKLSNSLHAPSARILIVLKWRKVGYFD